MDYQKYKNNGWGLSTLALERIAALIKENNIKKIIEFGSGVSTMFLSDLNLENNYGLDVTSFDNDLTYAYKIKENDCVKLLIRNLLECSDDNYNKMFNEKLYQSSLMMPKKSPLETRQKNNFYDIKENDITGNYDLIILDGPNGNGRNFAFLHLQNHLKSGAIIFIDDYNHYDFTDKCLLFFDCEELFRHDEGKDKFIILKIK